MTGTRACWRTACETEPSITLPSAESAAPTTPVVLAELLRPAGRELDELPGPQAQALRRALALEKDTEAGKALAAAGINAQALSGGDDAQARRLALQAWAVVHGLAMLMLDGRVPPDDALIDATIDSGSLFRGYGSNSDASP